MNIQVSETPKNRRLFHVFFDGLEYKRCATCHKWSLLDGFYKSKSNWDGYHKICVLCQKNTYLKNRALKNAQRLENQRKNKDKINQKNRERRVARGDDVRLYFREYHQKNTANSLYVFKKNIRRLIKHAFSGVHCHKKSKTKTILGVKDWKHFEAHLLETFRLNYKRNFDITVDCVHIDHVVPLSTAKTEEEVIKLNHFTNLQLLLEKDNVSKSSKLNWSLNHGC